MRTDTGPGTSGHIVIATAGSLGDLHPFLALGCELSRRGHRVSIATSVNHEAPVRQAGLAFRHMRPDPQATASFHARYMHPKTGGRFVYRDYLAPAIRDGYADLEAATRDADLLVSQSLMALAAPLVARRTGMPWVSAVLQPMSFFSLHDRPTYLPLPSLSWLCGRSPELHAKVFHYVRKHTAEWVEPVDALRRELGIDEDGHPLYEGQHSPARVLAMFSPLLGERRPDWPAAVVQTGTALFRQPPAPLPAGLRAFLARQDRPLAIFTLSSAASNDAGNFYRDSLAAAGSLGLRALLIMYGLSSASALPSPLPDWAMRVAYAPFDAVFPHADVIVHSGGIGTAFSALLAGKPQIMVPHAHDQLDNALRLARHGAAVVVRDSRAGKRVLRHALRTVLDDARMPARAEALARQARREEGSAIALACNEIEAVLRERMRRHA